MTSVARHFAEIATTLEDMHAIAVEARQADLSTDMSAMLTAALRLSSARLIVLIASKTNVGACRQ